LQLLEFLVLHQRRHQRLLSLRRHQRLLLLRLLLLHLLLQHLLSLRRHRHRLLLRRLQLRTNCCRQSCAGWLPSTALM
jgi:hypothetical protein